MDTQIQGPVLKIGAVVVKKVTRDILILRPIPKHPGEVPLFVLPRGSRQYQDEAGAWHDARDAVTGERYQEKLEPVARGLAREIEEEAGVTPAMLAASRVTELGPLLFQSRTKGVYPIHWFIVEVSEAIARQMGEKTPEDALATRWATRSEINAMAAAGEFSPGYVRVIEQAMEKLQGA